MAEILLGDRKLTDLKVTALKAELDKRGLPKKGVKSVLVERLKKAILQEELSNVATEDENGSELDTTLDTSQDESMTAELVKETPVAVDDGTSVDPAASHVTSEPIAVEEPVVEVTEESAEVFAEPETASGQESESEKLVQPPICEETVAEEIETVTMETTESLDVSVEEEVVKGGFQQPMDLGSPLDSDPEFDLSGDLLVPGEQQEGVEPEPDLDEEEQTGDQQQQQLLDGEGEKEREETTEQEEKDGEGEEAMEDKAEEEERAGERRVERLDSNFDSSYQPGAEELLYEGDPDNETETKPETEEEVEGTPTKDDATPDTVSHEQQQQQQDSQRGCEKEATGEKREEDVGFMVEVHYKDQGGSLEDPVAVNPGPQEASGKKEASKASGDGSKTTSDSSRLSGCHLWVAGLVSSVRALDLQTLFSSFGQVLSAKVVAKAHSKARFGYVTLATAEQAQKCITELNGSELKGSTIHVEVAKTPPPFTQPSADEGKPGSHRSPSSSSGTRSKEGGGKDGSDSRRDKDKVGQSINKSGDARSDGKGGSGEKGGERKDERRRSSGTSRSHDDRPLHSRRSRSPPQRRSPRGGRMRGGRSSPPPRPGYGPPMHRGPNHSSRDARHDIIRREEQRRDLMERRLGADPYYHRDGSRQVMMDERRLADRYQEMATRRQLEMEHTRREQEMARRMQEVREREAREREARERQLAEQERVFKERERVMREREYRERQRREQLEKELHEREQREKDMRERERRLREQHMRELQEREMKVVRERELRERQVQAQIQRESELREKEQRLLQEHQRIQKEKQMYEEQQRRLREEAERQVRERELREREARENRERERKMEVERERRMHEEKERREREKVEEERVKLERVAKLEREREQKRKQDELKWEREREQRERVEREREQRQRIFQQQQQQQQQHRLGKRGGGGGGGGAGYQDSTGYDAPKRQAVHDLRGNSVRGNEIRGGVDMYEMSSSVFSRLDPQKQAEAVGQLTSGIPSMTGMIPGGKTGMTSPPESYARRNTTGGGGGGSGGYRPGGGGGGYAGGGGRERHLDGVSYPMASVMGKSGQTQAQPYQKTAGSIGGGVSVVHKGGSGGLSRQNQDIITAALANIQKSVHQNPAAALSNQGMRIPGGSSSGATSVQQVSPGGHMSSLGGGGGGMLGEYVSLGGRSQQMGGQMSSSMGGVSRQMMGGVSASNVIGKPVTKLPPEDERYNRRFSRPAHGGGGRQATYKRMT